MASDLRSEVSEKGEKCLGVLVDKKFLNECYMTRTSVSWLRGKPHLEQEQIPLRHIKWLRGTRPIKGFYPAEL